METLFTKSRSSDAAALAEFETAYEFESNSPFKAEHHDHEAYSTDVTETEALDQFSNELLNPVDEYDFSSELESEKNYNPPTELEIVQEIE